MVRANVVKMYVSVLLLLAVVTPSAWCIDCFRCNSTGTLDCLEKFLQPNPLRPQPCDDIMDARFCIKATGAYDLHIGTKRFCSKDDMGDYCEFVTIDNREYRSCVYTCHSNGCNNADKNTHLNPFLLLFAILALWWIS